MLKGRGLKGRGKSLGVVSVGVVVSMGARCDCGSFVSAVGRLRPWWGRLRPWWVVRARVESFVFVGGRLRPWGGRLRPWWVVRARAESFASVWGRLRQWRSFASVGGRLRRWVVVHVRGVGWALVPRRGSRVVMGV